jgi:hypothetical protein
MSERRSGRCADAATTTATRPPLASALANCTAPSLARPSSGGAIADTPFQARRRQKTRAAIRDGSELRQRRTAIDATVLGRRRAYTNG